MRSHGFERGKQMKPTVGRIVHYTNLGDADGKYPPEQQAAIITKVKPRDLPTGENWNCEEMGFVVSLHIFYPTGQFDIQDVPFSTEYNRGQWSWPPRE